MSSVAGSGVGLEAEREMTGGQGIPWGRGWPGWQAGQGEREGREASVARTKPEGKGWGHPRRQRQRRGWMGRTELGRPGTAQKPATRTNGQIKGGTYIHFSQKKA